jgi:hypothetical protein
MELDKELIDKLLAGYKGPEDLIGEQGLLKQLTKALVERAMHAELTHHLGYEKHDPGSCVSGREPGRPTSGPLSLSVGFRSRGNESTRFLNPGSSPRRP